MRGSQATLLAAVLFASLLVAPGAATAQEVTNTSATNATNAADDVVERGQSWIDDLRQWVTPGVSCDTTVENARLSDTTTVERIEWCEDNTATLHTVAEEDDRIGVVDIVGMSGEGEWRVQVVDIEEGKDTVEVSLQDDDSSMTMSMQSEGEMRGVTVSNPTQPFLEDWTWKTSLSTGAGAVVFSLLIIYLIAYDRRNKHNKEWSEGYK